MKRIATLALALAALACSAGPPRIVLLGDSITWGLVSGPEQPSFATLLEHALGDSAEVRNVACGGLTVKVWLADATPAFCQREAIHPNLFQARLRPLLPADVVVVLLGTNDAIALGGRVEPEEYGRRLKLLTTQLLEHGARHVLLLAPPFNNSNLKASGRLRGYVKQVRAACAEDEAAVCGPDLFNLLSDSDFGRNELHPNGQGHAKIAVAIEAALRSLIEFEVPSPGN